MLYYIFFHFSSGDLLELLRERFVPDLHRLFFELHDLRLLRCLERFTPDFEPLRPRDLRPGDFRPRDFRFGDLRLGFLFLMVY